MSIRGPGNAKLHQGTLRANDGDLGRACKAKNLSQSVSSWKFFTTVSPESQQLLLAMRSAMPANVLLRGAGGRLLVST